MFVASAALFPSESDSVVNIYHIPADITHTTFYSVSSVYNHMHADRGMECVIIRNVFRINKGVCVNSFTLRVIAICMVKVK